MSRNMMAKLSFTSSSIWGPKTVWLPLIFCSVTELYQLGYFNEDCLEWSHEGLSDYLLQCIDFCYEYIAHEIIRSELC